MENNAIMSFTTLIITEKPSLAEAVAKYLDKNAKKDMHGCYYVNQYCIAPLSGHVLELCMPEEYDMKYKAWKLETMPFFPADYKLKIKEDFGKWAGASKKKVALIKELLTKTTDVINCGDPDREGQLLVDELLIFLNNKKPVKRILINAYDDLTIKRAFANIKDNKEFHGLYLNALGRSYSDFDMGIWLTRAYTVLGNKKGYDGVLSVGRVQTPTLGLVVKREQEIRNFKPTTYYNVDSQFKHTNGQFWATWQYAGDIQGVDANGRLTDKKIAEALTAKINGKQGVIKDYSKKKESEKHPKGLSLTILKTLAGKKLGFTSEKTLDMAQKLYETYKLTTYPRSDCEYLPEVMHADSALVFKAIQRTDTSLTDTVAGADGKIKSQIFNDKKTSAHHAIIPTINFKADLKEIDKDAYKLYNLIAEYYLSQFYPLYEYYATVLTVECEKELFKATGRTTIHLGWKAVIATESKDSLLPDMKANDDVKQIDSDLREGKTSAPPRYTDSSLEAEMGQIHKHVTNPELKKRLKENEGIGTEATKTQIIKTLIDRNYVIAKKVKSGLELSPTKIGEDLIAVVSTHISDPGLTAILEQFLDKVSNKEAKFEDFMKEQRNVVQLIINDVKKKMTENVQIGDNVKYLCDKCNEGYLMKRKGKDGPFWGCNNYPTCSNSKPDLKGKPDMSATPRKDKVVDPTLSTEQFTCPECKKGKLVQRSGVKGKFWGCNNYPKCKKTAPDENNKPKLN